MIQEDLKTIKSDYSLFNVMLFNNSLPNSSKIDFILHDMPEAVGYSKHCKRANKNTGNYHEIAFCKYYKFDRDFIREVLIHEMIHLWQDSHVSEKRYKVCSWMVAHDRVFTSKMNTINLILQKNFYDIKIDTVCKKKLELDPRINSDKEFYVIFLEDFGRHHIAIKTKYKRKIISQILDKNKEKELFKNVFYIKTNSYRYNLLKYVKSLNNELLSSSKDMFSDEDWYNTEINNNPTWIIKDEQIVK